MKTSKHLDVKKVHNVIKGYTTKYDIEEVTFN